MSSSKGSVLIFGLSGMHNIAGAPPEFTPEMILSGVQRSVESARSAGWDSDYLLFDHEDKQVIEKVSTKLKEKKWDVVCIGAGVRLTPQLTWLFEDATNAAVTLVKPTPRLVFQISPDGLVDRLNYQFPDKA